MTDLYSDKQFPFKNALVALEVDKPKLFETVTELLSKYRS